MNPEIFAIYFPSWHPDAQYARWYGNGFSEWELLKTTQPLFAGHHQPKEPVWGFFDESDPIWMKRQIDLAADHGITGFLFDWYWYQGEKFLHQPLEEGFLHSANRNRLKFALMWANHNWGKWPALDPTSGMLGNENQTASLLLKIQHSPADLEAVAEYCCSTYFQQKNYWRINGKPVFAFYDLAVLTRQLGSIEQAAEALERMQRIARNFGFDGMHLVANIGCCNDNSYCCGWDRTSWAQAIGFESVFAYNIVRTASYGQIPDEMPVVDYREVIDSHIFCWKKIEEGGLKHFPSVTLGCDVSPRWQRNITLPMDFKSLSYEPIIVGNTPEHFGELVHHALHLCRNRPGTATTAVILNAWNEWTEGMFLLPEKRYGTAYLEEVQNAARSLLD